ncbi:hypothetical protein V5O48_014425 [Marasmius crinis-equi]|uniref:Cytochrome P450 n=1 Tax=Marasmius crinis-equi TaxID=585013 RepID=A0ABR3EXD1_9AGAR
MPWLQAPSSTLSAIILVVFAWLLLKLLSIGRRESHLPPGPPTVPLLGNLNVFPTEYAHYNHAIDDDLLWRRFTEWARQYGDIYSLKVTSGTAVVLTGTEVVKELMDKRSATTSDRPSSHMAEKVTGGMNMGFEPYSERCKISRRAVHAVLTPSAVAAHFPIQRAEATQALYDFLKTPNDFYTHILRTSNSIIMSVLYGKRCPRYDSHESKAFYEVNHLWNMALEPGAIDILPILDWVPERWASWKKIAKEVKRLQRALYFGLVDETEERIRRGDENGSYMEEVLKRRDEFGLNREMIGYLGGVLLEGGSETSAVFLQSLVLLLIAFPEVQRKAQEEVDRVIGRDRLPSLEDIDDLPYIQALIKETHRYRPVTPLLVPHATAADEEYRGFIIPKGTTIFVNLYGIFHDPDVFEDPELFNPDRYIKTEFGTKAGVDDSSWRSNLHFGCGRRICPGMHLANNAMALNTMNFVWAFDFKPAKGPNGQDIPADVNAYEKGLSSVPKPFDCIITPRHAKVSEIIEREFQEATDTFIKFERDLVPADKAFVEEQRRGL